MSYNIGHIEYLGEGRLRINAAVRKKLSESLDRLPEGNFLESDGCVESVYGVSDGTEELLITKPWWYGEGSGRSKENLKKALSKTTGCADLLLTWDGGDSHSGLRVINGRVTEHEVVFALGEEVRK
jgi:hypothetical protein